MLSVDGIKVNGSFFVRHSERTIPLTILILQIILSTTLSFHPLHTRHSLHPLHQFVMSLLQRVRDNGSCPPSLLGDERNVGDVAFDALISRILDPAVPNSKCVCGILTSCSRLENIFCVGCATSVCSHPGPIVVVGCPTGISLASDSDVVSDFQQLLEVS